LYVSYIFRCYIKDRLAVSNKV